MDLLGHDHEENGVMQQAQSAGPRRIPSTSDVGAFWTLAGLPDSMDTRDPSGWRG
jgi:hypothetical protein